MKVLHVIPSVSPIRGGPSQAIFGMTQALQEKNIRVEIVTTNDNGTNLLKVPLNQLIPYQGVSTRFFNRFSPNHLGIIREFSISDKLTYWLWQNIQEYDLLHIHAIFSYPSTISMLISHLKEVPYINRPLGQLCHWSLRQSYLKKKIYFEMFERHNLNYSSALHFTSQREQEESRSVKLKTPSFVIPHGLVIPKEISTASQRLHEHFKIPIKSPIILFLSRLHPKKGLDFLIPALGKLKHLQFSLILAGDGDSEYIHKIRHLLTTYSIYDRTYFPGFVEGEFKELLLQGSDLFVLTSYSENFGIVVLEALAAGLPVLLTPQVALSNQIKKYNLGYVVNLEVYEIATQLEYCLLNADVIKQIGDRARQFVRDNYTWNRTAAQLIEVYTAILNKQPIPEQFLP
ncbi:glycosyltransferase [Trichothermofontia sp.]